MSRSAEHRFDLQEPAHGSVDELADAFWGDDGHDADELVVGDADLVACLNGRVRVGDFAGVRAVEVLEEEPEAHGGEPTAAIPPLAASELAHYAWLIGGLLDGAFALAASECADLSTVPTAIDGAREAFTELLHRLDPEGDR